MKPHHPLHGLVTATHSPFTADGAVNLAIVEAQAAHLLKNGVGTVFINGSTGESSSLSHDERQALAERWKEVVRGTSLRVVVHVGSNNVAESCSLAAHAQRLGATAIAALSPSYFKPRNLDALIDCCTAIAGAAPETPFYFYDIPVLTGVNLPMPEFLERAAPRIPTLAGLKFTNPDLMSYQYCIRANGGAWDVPFGLDEFVLGALALGARGAVGSGYNFAAPIYTRLFAAFARGDMEAARTEQFRGVQLVKLLAGYGYMGAAKAVMKMLGVDVGPARLPNTNLSADEVTRLRGELETLGFFDWIRP